MEGGICVLDKGLKRAMQLMIECIPIETPIYKPWYWMSKKSHATDDWMHTNWDSYT